MLPVNCLPPEADHVLIAVNPRAGSGRQKHRLHELVDTLEARKLTVAVMGELEQVTVQALSLHERGRLRALVAAGGDGTAAELVNRTPPGLPIALFPLGTENLLARYLGQGPDAGLVADAICAGVTNRFDAGRAGQRLFLLMVGCGFDGEVIQRAHARRQGHIRRWHYLQPIWESIRNYEYPELRIYCEGAPPGAVQAAESALVAHWAFVFNFPVYGGGLRILPSAQAADGMLDLCTFRGGSLWQGLSYVASIYLGWHKRLADFATRQACHLRIESEKPVAYQLDGDPGGTLPVEIDVLPGRMTLIVPPTWWQTRGEPPGPPQAAASGEAGAGTTN